MTYTCCFRLKFMEGIPTTELLRRYPADRQRICDIALLDLPFDRLRRLIPRADLMRLKKLIRSLKATFPTVFKKKLAYISIHA